MITILLILIFLLLLGISWKLFKGKEDAHSSSFEFIQREIHNLHKTMDDKMGKTQDSVKEQFEHSQKLIRDITREIAEVKKTNEQVFSITESLSNLEKVLKNQKQRGNLGEEGLKLILENFLPPSAYELQYSLGDNLIVDAVIHTKNGVIPVDAKFSLDNYTRAVNEDDEKRKSEYEKEFQKDLKKRIDETSKYIREQDGTLPFALMYIPAEGIYYDLLVGSVGGLSSSARNLIEYARKDKQVIIVSPTTFVAYLHTILQGFRAFQIEERAREIEKNVEKLGRHIASFDEYHTKLGNSLSTTVNHFNRSRKELKKMDKDVLKIAETSADVEDLILDKPQKED